MSGVQWIFIVLVLLITWGGFIEASAHRGFSLSFSRVILALVLPVLQMTFIAQPFWNELGSASRNKTSDSYWAQLTSGFLVVVFAIGVQILAVALVATNVVWIGGALTGDLQKDFWAWLARYKK